MDVGVPKCWSDDPASVALVDPQPGAQTILDESRGAAGYKRPRIVEFVTPHKIPVMTTRTHIYLHSNHLRIGTYNTRS
ncbi:jg59 [Pararge aegeria aegeria]|uniref:Jg59 protein n=1 Tax=Pararge aegeria aegeria TaxID=348720 RepID=A0A8S4QAM1_9NEOP|nr:jg59 [Pararge aegeria aegeria]